MTITQTTTTQATTPPDLATHEEGDGGVWEILERALEGAPRVSATRVGLYDLGERIAEGGTSIVYRVLNPSKGRPQVLRMMNQRAPSKTDIEQYRRGLLIARDDLDHPNILRLDDVGDHEGLPYAVMPLVGSTLECHLAFEQWTPERAVKIMLQLADAVDHAHRRGFIHRDIKPSNILWQEGNDGSEGTPLLIDFGSARRMDPRESLARSTTEGGLTLTYMAPEQAKGSKTTWAADIYSLGVLFYQMLTRRLPYEGSLAEVLSGLTSEPGVVPPREYAAGLHWHIEEVCLGCLEKNPEERYPSARALAVDLRRLDIHRPPLRAGNFLQRTHRSLRRRQWRSVGVSLTLCAVAALTSAHALQAAALARTAEIASDAAAFIALRFGDAASEVRKAASDPAVVGLSNLAESKNRAQELMPYVEKPRSSGVKFSGMFVMTADGFMLAHYPSAGPSVFSNTFIFRDYLSGGLELGGRMSRESAVRDLDAAYIARAFRSETTQRLEVGFAVALSEQRVLLGRWSVRDIRAMREGSAAAGAPPCQLENERAAPGLGERLLGLLAFPERCSVLIGPRDRDRTDYENGSELPRGYVYLDHPRINEELGNRHPLDAGYASELEEAFGEPGAPGEQLQRGAARPVLFERYRDPLFSGTYLAAAAAVGRTGYAVLVQARNDIGEQSLRLGTLFTMATTFCAVLWLALSRYAKSARRRINAEYV